MGGLPDRTHPPRQRPPPTETPRTETPWTETPLDRDPSLDRVKGRCKNITFPQLRLRALTIKITTTSKQQQISRIHMILFVVDCIGSYWQPSQSGGGKYDRPLPSPLHRLTLNQRGLLIIHVGLCAVMDRDLRAVHVGLCAGYGHRDLTVYVTH